MVVYLTISLLLCAVIQVYYWYVQFGSLVNHQSALVNSQNGSEPVSVILCAYNAYHLLERHLPHLINQKYPSHEIVVQDDFSTDETFEKIKWIDNERRILSAYKVNQKVVGKKQALWEGIDHARHKWLIMTDADCKPLTNQWIMAMMAAKNQGNSQKTKIILGYSPYALNGTNVGYWSHYEGWITAIQYLSAAIKGWPYMGVGRNTLYQKDLISKSILDKYGHLASGDDDLTVMQVATAENTGIALDPDSFVETMSESSWAAYYRQKRRHFSTGAYYKLSTQLRLGLYSISLSLFYLLFFGLLMMGGVLPALLIYGVRMLFILPMVNGLKKKLKAEFKLAHYLLLDAGQALFYLIFSVAVLFPQKNKW